MIRDLPLRCAAAALAAATLHAAPALAQSGSANVPLDERVSRLERVLDSGTLVDLLDRVQSLQEEVQKLRGALEVQGHTLSQLKDRQRDLYLDLDRRLQRMEARGASGGGGSAAAGGGDGGAQTAMAQGGAAPVSPQPGSAAGTGAAAGAGTGGAEVASAAPAAGTAPAQDEAAQQSAYQAAFDLLKAGQYEQAIAAFKDYLQRYPGGKLADNAQYWLGEAYYVTRRFEPALQEFETLVQRYPDSPKLTHGLLKIGFIRDELGQKQEATQVLEDLIKRYPNSTAARLARERLQRIRGGA